MLTIETKYQKIANCEEQKIFITKDFILHALIFFFLRYLYK